jgi:anti-anti-sigma factor
VWLLEPHSFRIAHRMHVELRKNGDVVIVDLKGKLTAGLGDQILRDTIDELLAEGWKKILLNLSLVTFIDSAGVGELVAGLKTVKRFGAYLRVLNTSERVHSSLYIAKLLPVFEVCASESEALFRFEEGAPSTTHPPRGPH